MPKITDRAYFDGALKRIVRLGLQSLWVELEGILSGFELLVAERRDANCSAEIRSILDERFRGTKGWFPGRQVDWTKCQDLNRAKVGIGVEIQFSGEDDLLLLDIAHLRDELVAGRIDVGVILVPSEQLAPFLADRVARFTDAMMAIERAGVQDLPLIVISLGHDGPGHALKKCKVRRPSARLSDYGGQPLSSTMVL